jgi:two-component system, NtrC family, sensor histidine kinase PilS
MISLARNDFSEPSSTFWVSLRYFSLTRLVIAAVLLGAVLMFGSASDFGSSDSSLFVRTAIVYAVLGTLLAYFAASRQQGFYVQLGAQLVLDVAALTVMLHASEGTRGGIAVLFLLPIAGTAILTPPLFAAFFAAVCALAILGETLLRTVTTEISSPVTIQAGVYGIAYFTLAIVMNRLAARVIAQERIAKTRFEDLQSQIEINRLVVADMQDGVLILSGDGHPRSLNPAAARMFRVTDPDALVRDGWESHPLAQQVREHFEQWRKFGAAAQSFEVAISTDIGDASIGSDRLRGRFAAPGTISGVSGDFVVFLEDQQRVDELAQQLKLASMGRLTASIAHEIRNPLAAISHANALLDEGTRSEGDRRLVSIISENTRRLDRIVQNILQLSRRASVNVDQVDVRRLVHEVIEEFDRDHTEEGVVIDVSIYGSPMLSFNEEHLRQVLVNLLQNAYRYATKQRGSISVVVVPVLPILSGSADGSGDVHRATERIEVIVQDDGEGIDAKTRQHLFEPFFTTHHRGTGLGLYLARELCLANGATLGYVPNIDESKKGGFVVNAAGTVP